MYVPLNNTEHYISAFEPQHLALSRRSRPRTSLGDHARVDLGCETRARLVGKVTRVWGAWEAEGAAFVRGEDRERGQDGREGRRRRCPRRSICGGESAFALGTAECALTVLITHGALFV